VAALLEASRSLCWRQFCFSAFVKPAQPEADPASEVKGAISLMHFGQISLGVYFCKSDEVYFTILLSQNSGRQKGLIS